MKDPKMLVLFIIICELAGFAASFITTPAIPTWYASLSKPVFSPPNWVFFPVWTILYLLMGVSLYLVWSFGRKKGAVKKAIGIFSIQLGLNVLWSLVFFGLRSILGGFAMIILMWFAIAAMIMSFGKISNKAAWLQFPYLMWVTFAMLLNFALLLIN